MSDAKVTTGKYKHFKGGEYEVIGVALHSETLEEFVVYRALYSSEEFGEGAIWIRPVKLFTEVIEREGKTIKRFEKIDYEG